MSLGSGDRAGDDAFDLPPPGKRPIPHFAAHPFMDGGIAHDAALADFLPPRLELRLDEGDQARAGAGEAHGALQHLGEGDEAGVADDDVRSEEHTSELQSLMRISYAVFCMKKKK